MSDSTVLGVAEDALEMISQLRDNEPGEEEFALSIEVTGFSGPQFSYELAFVPLADMKDGWIEERHGDLAIIFPKIDTGKLEGSTLELTDEGLSMNNPNSPETPAMSATKGDLSGPLVDRVNQVITEQGGDGDSSDHVAEVGPNWFQSTELSPISGCSAAVRDVDLPR